MRVFLLSVFCFFLFRGSKAQSPPDGYRVVNARTGEPLAGVTIKNAATGWVVKSDAEGFFQLAVPADSIGGQDGKLVLECTSVGFEKLVWRQVPGQFTIRMVPASQGMDEVVVTGTMRAVNRSASPVPVEIYTPQFLRKNPTPSLFDALQLVNGVRPQLNCNVCNTGDIHINGLEGPYTMVLIDGMPIVSSLATVYGLQGIPNSLVERIEIVKGPASSLYGSEAIGGLINIITKQPGRAPLVSVEYNGSSWREHNLDAGMRFRTGKRSQALAGINYFNYTHRYDRNRDNFTDVTLQNRLSLFQKIQWTRKHDRQASMAMRLVGEQRWGGEMQWTRAFRGGDSIYGEQITTRRAELVASYQLPLPGKILFSFSANTHQQRSAYGNTIFDADQHIGFGQITWEKDAGKKHRLLAGIVGRYTWYDDNTPVTADLTGQNNQPDRVFLPGIFLQDDISLGTAHQLLTGIRYDYDKRHGNIFTPRLAWKWKFSGNDYLRLNLGTGFRVVNLFTEEHAALTGARKVEVLGSLKPERSYNANLNYTRRFVVGRGFLNLEAAAWYTYFSNRILPDYDTDPDKIIYANLDGYSESKGASLNLDGSFGQGFRFTTGFTLQDVSTTGPGAGGKNETRRQVLTERWSGTWTLSYSFGQSGWSADYTGNIYGPMVLPLLSDLDPRRPFSPVWSLQNIQVTRKWKNGLEWFGGIKNLLGFTPGKNNPFLIARSFDPFDREVQRDAAGKVIPTENNPYALSFDPTYMYAPNQGRKLFIGFRYALKGKL